ncbi:hypothetical protein L226DRAFT_25381 [Lentinus tigrinus ALCF2SS1-7]|uniref:uncharacterized protein n=1 Tax=Lentinus tigrinus ALCF2SS1-7 TaxID=1328758 RepID=UPI0011661CFC|nr:hypothetical protein L226DRAFT_25381 [Lentinus tigrinus ALCF2SS1-7]
MNAAIRKPGCLSSLPEYNPVWSDNTIVDSCRAMTSSGVSVPMVPCPEPLHRVLRDICPPGPPVLEGLGNEHLLSSSRRWRDFYGYVVRQEGRSAGPVAGGNDWGLEKSTEIRKCQATQWKQIRLRQRRTLRGCRHWLHAGEAAMPALVATSSADPAAALTTAKIAD